MQHQHPPRRGGIYPYQGARGNHHLLLIVSVDALNRSGTAVGVEVVPDAPSAGLAGLVTVQLGRGDPLPGHWVLCWRIGYAPGTARLASTPGSAGVVTPATMNRVMTAIGAIIGL